MTVPSIRNPNFQAIDSSGNPLEGGKLYVFEPGQITTAKTSYTDSELTAGQENTHPIILDSKGECELYYSGTARLRLFTSDDVLVDDWDNVGSSGDINTEWVSSLTPTFASSTSFTLSGDQTSAYHANRRIRATDSSTLYGYITSSSYSAPNTTVNVTLDSGSLSASLSEVSVGIVSAINTSLPSNSVSTAINNATAKTTPVDADVVGLVDSAASNVLKKLSWANIKATLLTYFSSVTATFSNKTLTSPTINDPSIGPSDSGLLATFGSSTGADHYIRFRNFAGQGVDFGFSLGLNSGGGGGLIFCGESKNFGIAVNASGTDFATAVDADLAFVVTSAGLVKTKAALEVGTSIELGHASDTTISRPAAGRAQIEGREIVTATASATQLTATIDELNTLDGITATVSELNILDNSAQAVSNHHSFVRQFLQSDGTAASPFAISANITENTFESVGPTGSGATNIYTGMDSIPTGATFVIFLAQISGESAAAGQFSAAIYGRPTGSTIVQGAGTELLNLTIDSDAAGESHQLKALVYVPLDSSLRCDLTWAAVNDTSLNIPITYRGYCI